MNKPLDFQDLIRQMTDHGMVSGQQESIASLLTEELCGLAAYTRTTGRQSHLTLKLSLKPTNDKQQVTIAPEWRVSMPPKRRSTDPVTTRQPLVVYVDEVGAMRHHHPGQQLLPIEEG